MSGLIPTAYLRFNDTSSPRTFDAPFKTGMGFLQQKFVLPDGAETWFDLPVRDDGPELAGDFERSLTLTLVPPRLVELIREYERVTDHRFQWVDSTTVRG